MTTIISIVATICGILGFALGQWRQAKKDSELKGSTLTELKKDLEHIKESTDKIDNNLVCTDKSIKQLLEITAVHDVQITELKDKFQDLKEDFNQCRKRSDYH